MDDRHTRLLYNAMGCPNVTSSHSLFCERRHLIENRTTHREVDMVRFGSQSCDLGPFESR